MSCSSKQETNTFFLVEVATNIYFALLQDIAMLANMMYSDFDLQELMQLAKSKFE